MGARARYPCFLDGVDMNFKDVVEERKQRRKWKGRDKESDESKLNHQLEVLLFGRATVNGEE